jgi:Sporulation and spore germination/Immunoglobulin-like domain of bacterial spore germination
MMKTFALALASTALALAVSACGGGGAESAGPVPSVPAKAVAADALTFELWFIGYETGGCCTVVSTSRTAEDLGIPHVGANFAVGPRLIETLVEALLAGPSPEEDAFGFASAIHADTRLLGVTFENGIVTVDLSSDFRCMQVQPCDSRGADDFAPEVGVGILGNSGLFVLAQVVYTVTQLPGVEGVRFEVDGRPAPVPSGTVLDEQSRLRLDKILAEKRLLELLDRPVTREDYEIALHSITFEAPPLGSEVASPLRVAGTANAPDGTVRAVLRDVTGSVLGERVARVTCGAGCRGDYEIEIPFEVSERQTGTIQLRFDEPNCRFYRGGRGCSNETPVTLLP